MNTCTVCSATLSGRQSRYCSKTCSMRGAAAARTTRTMYPAECGHCGAAFHGYSKTTRYCSVLCGVAALHGPDRQPKSARRRRALAALRKAAQGTRGTATWVAGCCARCGSAYVRRMERFLPQHCSARCQDRDKCERRRAREAGVVVTRIMRHLIHEADGWRCHICGDPVDRSARAPALAAPVLDHVVALARGGPHAAENLRTAHFYCNSVKRDLDLAAVC